ncbi:MAG: hypothetical protein JNL89_00975 [Rhodanobacteraceae bacterium]|nr:hypothetical protein [Rhodanobacteraceae bacterium]
MDQPVDDENAGGPQRERVSLDRLRERTDELELLISGLSMVALFALPGWLLERYYDNYTQLPISLLAAAISIVPMGIAFAYTLGSCFLLHLVVRACWVGLIGLHATFPHGVRWERLPGPIQRERLRARMAPLPRAIASADRLASTLYSLITLVALLLLWMGGVFTLALLVAFAIGQALNATNTVLSGTIDLLALTLIANGLLLWLLDGVLAQRFPGLARISIVQWLVAASATLNRVVLPDRLIGPVRLTLQSNTSPRLFNLMLLLLLISVPFLGMRYFRGQTTFDAFGTQRYVDAVDTRGGIRSQHYASLRTRQDRLRAWPVIPDRVISTPFTTLFLPYLPTRDDPVIVQRCPQLPTVQERPEVDASDRDQVAGRSGATAACLARLWRVELDGVGVDLAAAEIAERADLGMRGLEVVLDLRQGAPGPRVLELLWRPDPGQDRALDDYVNESVYVRIPLVWAPGS